MFQIMRIPNSSEDNIKTLLAIYIYIYIVTFLQTIKATTRRRREQNDVERKRRGKTKKSRIKNLLLKMLVKMLSIGNRSRYVVFIIIMIIYITFFFYKNDKNMKRKRWLKMQSDENRYVFTWFITVICSYGCSAQASYSLRLTIQLARCFIRTEGL